MSFTRSFTYNNNRVIPFEVEIIVNASPLELHIASRMAVSAIYIELYREVKILFAGAEWKGNTMQNGGEFSISAGYRNKVTKQFSGYRSPGLWYSGNESDTR